MTKNLYLFVDTNLFIQCKDLADLDWSEWRDFAEVHLIVSLPVQREIDRQKTRGNERVGRRARKTYSSLFRHIATGEKGCELVKEVEPRVKLLLEAPSRPDPKLADNLDYSKPDDEIIGCLSRFVKEHPCLDVRLLTHDTGPMMTARSLGLPVEPIKEDWILTPENSNAEREVLRLQEEVAQLKKAEPQFELKCVDDKGADISVLELTHRVYRPLSEDDISHLFDLLKRRFPMKTVFDRSGSMPTTLTPMNVLGLQRYYEPASEEAIANYKEREYPTWLRVCRAWLTGAHEDLQRDEGLPGFIFEVENVGSRPGKDALVVIRASGDFKICPPPNEEDEPEETEETGLQVPAPPTPPRGRLRLANTSFEGMLKGLNRFRSAPLVQLPSPGFQVQLPRPDRRDPNGFYYKPTRITEPAESFNVECEQWRHGTGSEPFVGNIFVEEGLTGASGVLECEIHAENLFKPALKRVPVRIEVVYPNPRSAVEKLIESPFDKRFRA